MKTKFDFFAVIFLVSFFLVTNQTKAAYLENVPQTLVQPNGIILHCFASGDEFYNWLHDANGYTIIKNPQTGYYVYAKLLNDSLLVTSYIAGVDSPVSTGLQPRLLISSQKRKLMREIYLNQIPQKPDKESNKNTFVQNALNSGTINNLVIFIRFAGEAEYSDNISVYQNFFNSTTVNTNSMKRYFTEASYNQLTINTAFYPITTNIVVSYQDSHDRNYYRVYDAITNPTGYQSTNRTEREQTMLGNAAQAVSSQIPTNLNIDNDNDGYVDNICFIVSGNAEGWAELLWPHKSALWYQTTYINGKQVWEYNFQLQTYLLNSGASVLCHEMFHSLGSPDLYHYSQDGLQPAYKWDLMGSNTNPPQHMGAFMKYQYGNWISSIPTITSAGTYTLNPLTSSVNNCYKILSPNSTSEFFMVEYRKRTSYFESALPGSGLLIYRIDLDSLSNGNRNGPPDLVYHFRPDGTITDNGLPDLANFSSSVGRTAFNSSTNPSCFLTTGYPGGISITNITDTNNTISFTVGFPKPFPDFTSTKNYECSGGIIQFMDLSANSPTNWEWTFNPGTVVFTNGTDLHSQNPYIQFYAPGHYTVSLKVSNLSGDSTIVKYDIIEITNEKQMPLTQNFDSLTFPPTDWAIYNPNNDTTWVRKTVAGSVTGQFAASIPFYNYTQTGRFDMLNTPAINIGETCNSYLKFKVAYRRYNPTRSDTLRILVYSGCGETYEGMIYNKSGSTLATGSDQTSAFVPSISTDWRTEQIDLSAFGGKKVIICFIGINGYGNNLYIDDIEINSVPILNYKANFATSISGTYSDLGTNGNVISTANFDNANSAVTNIGFAFNYNSAVFTQFILNTNGFIKLGNTPLSSDTLFFSTSQGNTGGPLYSSNPADINILAPFNHDLMAGTSTPQYRVYTSGTSPNRVCTIQFKNLRDKTTSPLQQFNNISFQIKLYETSNIIEFVYGSWSASANASAFKSAGCGLKGSGFNDCQLLLVGKGSTQTWDAVYFQNSYYILTGNYGFNFGNPPSRPAPDPGRTFRFIPVRINDLSVGEIYSMGDASLNYSNPQSISVNIINSGYNNFTHIPVTLTVSGANSFTDTKYISTLNSDENTKITFANFVPTSNGSTNIVVSIPNDDYNADNLKTWIQNTNDYTCNYSSTANSYSGWGGSENISYAKYHVSGTANVSSVKAYIYNYASNIGQTVYGIVLNSVGIIVGQSANYVIQAGDLDGWHTFPINAPPTIANADFYAGFAATAGSTAYYALGIQSENPCRGNTYYFSNIDGTGLTQLDTLTFIYRYMIGATLSPTPPIAGTAASNSVICSGNNASMTLTGYTGNIQWQQSSNGSTNWINVTGGIGSNSANYTTKNLTSTTYYRAQLTQTGFLAVYSNIITVTVNYLPVAAGTISGLATVCQGQNSVIYSVPTITNATTYVWTLPTGAGGTSSTASITVNYGTSAVSGNITVKGNNACGDGISSSKSITVNSLPVAAGTITGLATVCQGQNSVTYSVPTITNATTYIWTLPTGVSGTSSTSSITVNYGTTAVSGNITVKGNNNCGDGISSSKSITVNPLPVAAGTITGLVTVCQGQNSVVYSVTTITNATTYIWTLSTGASGTSSTSSITVNYGTTAVSGNITVKGNNACGDGVSSSKAITVNPLPVAAGTISGLATVCQGQNSVTYSVSTITNASSYIWTLPEGASGTSSTASITVNYGSSAVLGNITVKGHNACGDGFSSSKAITVNPLPIANAGSDILVCTGDTARLVATGGVSYQWNNGITQNVPFIPEITANYIVQVTNQFNCTKSDTVLVTVEKKLLLVNALLEGLYAGNSLMNNALNENGEPQWDASIADKVNIDIRNATTPYSVIQSLSVNLSVNSEIKTLINCHNNTSYYIVISNRNHLETWSAAPVSFAGDTVFYNFTNAATKAYGDNQKQVAPGVFAIFAGDADGSGFIDGDDFNGVDNLLYTGGYLNADVNGNGYIDGDDFNIIDNNLYNGVITP